jgi:hypothetical protein
MRSAVFICALASVTICAPTHAQDTLAIVEPKFGVGDTEVTFVGDTMLVRLMFDKKKTARQGSEAAWYSPVGKITNVDLTALGKSDIMGIMKHHDTLHYYSKKTTAKKGEVAVYVSDGLRNAALLSSTSIAGIAVRGFPRGHNFLVVSWEQSSQTIHIYEFNRNRVINEKHVVLGTEFKNIKATEIGFSAPGEPGRISVTSATLRFLLHDDTFAAVYDMPGSHLKKTTMTKIVRLDLTTGKEVSQTIPTDENYGFKSFLFGSHLLYRLVSLKQAVLIYVHDLDMDSNIVASYPITIPKKEDIATKRFGAAHKITKAKMADLTGFHTRESLDIGIVVDEYKDEQILSIGVINDVKGAAGPPSSVGVPAVASILWAVGNTALMQMKDDPNVLTYLYLRGKTESGYKIVDEKEAADFLKIRIDNMEFEAQKKGDIDYWSHFTNKNYCVSLNSYLNSPRFFITTFPIIP